MTLDCQSAAVAERRPAERTINTITPTTARAPRRIHSQMRLVPDPLLAAGEPLGVDGPAVGVVAGLVTVLVTVLVTGLGVLGL
jgi:hypothetical protein